jgi:DNA-binding NarL/FixJ family response regulator
MARTDDDHVRGALSSREREILRALVTGQNNSQIASELFISRETVKTHVSNIFIKLGTENRVQAAVEAVRRGLD